MKKFLQVIGVNLLIFAVIVLLIEGALQLRALTRPSYDVLYLQPEPELGWKQVPNLGYTWAGTHWYADDFTVDVQANSLGFRDAQRDFQKPAGTTRVALLGDSMIEAIQVPFEQTGGHLLERKLNQPADADRRWEVLNFGISNYGVGQYLLSWEQYARRFQPDYVAVFVAAYHMRRTITEYEFGAFRATAKERLQIRPTFSLHGDSLAKEPARDYEKFGSIQRQLIEREFDGKRIRKKRILIIGFYARDLLRRLNYRVNRFRGYQRTELRPGVNPDTTMLAVNVWILEELGRQVQGTGARLIVIDVSRYFGDDETVANTLRDVSARNGFGYIPLYSNLMSANAKGVATKWPNDIHFNVAGNEILAQSLNDWMIRNRAPASGPTSGQ